MHIPRNHKSFYLQTQKSACPRTRHSVLPKCCLPGPPSSCAHLDGNLRNLPSTLSVTVGCLACHEVLCIGCHSIFSSLPPLTLQWPPNPSLLAWAQPLLHAVCTPAAPGNSLLTARLMDPPSSPSELLGHRNQILSVPCVPTALGLAHHLWAVLDDNSCRVF